MYFLVDLVICQSEFISDANLYFFIWACPFVKTAGQVVRYNLCSTLFHRGFPLPPFMRAPISDL